MGNCQSATWHEGQACNHAAFALLPIRRHVLATLDNNCGPAKGCGWLASVAARQTANAVSAACGLTGR